MSQGMHFGLLSLAGAPVAAVNQVQTLTVTGSPTGGSLTVTIPAALQSFLGLDDDTTGTIAHNANAAAVETALEALIGEGNCSCSGSGFAAGIDVEFTGSLAGFNWAELTTSDSLTGGTSPESAVEVSVTGVAASYRGASKDTKLADTENGILYTNTGTEVAPIWTRLPVSA